MNPTLKNILLILGLIIAAGIVFNLAFKIVGFAVGLAFKAIGVALVAGVVYLGYKTVKTKMIDRR